jgi:hypothetical protein
MIREEFLGISSILSVSCKFALLSLVVNDFLGGEVWDATTESVGEPTLIRD